MTPTSRRRALAFAWACVLGATPLVAQKGIPTVDRAKLVKLAEPWPDAETLKASRLDAENRRLFADSEPIAFTLAADFKAINKDRNPESTNMYPGVLTVDGPGGGVLHVQLRPRGHLRRNARTCSFVPIRVEFDKDEVKGTVFEHQKALKLVTHCQNDKEYEQYPLREYLAYRALNLLTPKSFRARLARPTYIQTERDAVKAGGAGAGKPMFTKWGVFIEDDNDVARRAEARVMDIPRVVFKDLDPDQTSLMMVFEYMISNTDYSIFALHNVKLLRTQDKNTYPIPYDFDLAGLVHTAYAAPNQGLGIMSVRDRLYRGPCRTEAEIQPILDLFKAHKADTLALYDSLTELDPDYRREAKDFLESFYSKISKPNDVKKIFVDGECSKKSLM